MRRWFWMMGVLFVAGCAEPAELAFTPEGLIDFGPSLPGVERSQLVLMLHRGGSDLALDETRSSHPAFSLALPSKPSISSGDTRLMTVTYVATPGPEQPENAELELLARGAVVATLHAAGRSTTPDCSVPAQLDFGGVARHDTTTLAVELRNGTTVRSVASVGTLADPFFVTSGSPEVAPGTAMDIPVTFVPPEVRTFSSVLLVSPHSLCNPQPVRLIGDGVTSVLSWTPSTADLGSVMMGSVARFSITFSNLRFEPVVLDNLQAREGGVPSAFSVAQRSLTVPGATRDEISRELVPGTASVEISFTPPALGPKAGQLTASTNLASQPMISINLRGVGAQ